MFVCFFFFFFLMIRRPPRSTLFPYNDALPIRAFLAELEQAEARSLRGEPAHLGDMIVRLARVSILRNTQLEERYADEKDRSLSELRSLRDDVLGMVDDPELAQAVARRFAG